MSTMHRNAPHRSRPVLRLRGLGVMVAIGLALVTKPAWAADGPRSTAQPDPSEAKPRASKRGIDDAARRALRASSSRSDAAPPQQPAGERVAMRTAAPAEPQGDPPKRGKSKRKPKGSGGKGDDGARAPSDDDARKISLDEDFLVEGKLEKPNAFYILRRSQSGYDWARLDAKFLPLVLESVQDPLF